MSMLAVWKGTKKQFEDLTGKKKPKVEPKKFKDIFKGGSVDLEGKLKKVDEAWEAIGEGDVLTDKGGKKYQAAVDAFSSSKAKYTQTLDAAINAEKDLSGDEKTVYLRGLKILKTTLEDIDARNKKNASVVGARMNDLMGDEVRAATHLTKLKAIVASTEASVQQIKADPRGQIYNHFVKQGSDALVAHLGEIAELVPEKANAANGLRARFAFQPVAVTAAPDVVLAAVKTFATNVKDVKAAFP